MDTADNGANQVTAAFEVPDGCQGPPPPPTVTLTVSIASAAEAGPVAGAFTVSRGTAEDWPVTISYTVGGTAANGSDYVAISTFVIIPAGAASAVVRRWRPIDDALARVRTKRSR